MTFSRWLFIFGPIVVFLGMTFLYGYADIIFKKNG